MGVEVILAKANHWLDLVIARKQLPQVKFIFYSVKTLFDEEVIGLNAVDTSLAISSTVKQLSSMM